jgi:hypothetical protein
MTSADDNNWPAVANEESLNSIIHNCIEVSDESSESVESINQVESSRVESSRVHPVKSSESVSNVTQGT